MCFGGGGMGIIVVSLLIPPAEMDFDFGIQVTGSYFYV